MTEYDDGRRKEIYESFMPEIEEVSRLREYAQSVKGITVDNPDQISINGREIDGQTGSITLRFGDDFYFDFKGERGGQLALSARFPDDCNVTNYSNDWAHLDNVEIDESRNVEDDALSLLTAAKTLLTKASLETTDLPESIETLCADAARIWEVHKDLSEPVRQAIPGYRVYRDEFVLSSGPHSFHFKEFGIDYSGPNNMSGLISYDNEIGLVRGMTKADFVEAMQAPISGFRSTFEQLLQTD